jgi:hypothetical protein
MSVGVRARPAQPNRNTRYLDCAPNLVEARSGAAEAFAPRSANRSSIEPPELELLTGQTTAKNASFRR